MENPKVGDIVLHGSRRARVVSFGDDVGALPLYELEFTRDGPGGVRCYRQQFTFPAPEPKQEIERAAYHEAAHTVIAAVHGLKVRPDGLMVDLGGQGISITQGEPAESDSSREGIILADFAGYWADMRFSEEHSYSTADLAMIELSPDWQHARQIILILSANYMAGKNPMQVQVTLENQSKHLVDEHWRAIEALAIALLAKDPQPMRPLKTGEIWSRENAARYVTGEEAVEILAQHGIAATCEHRVCNT